MANAFELTVEPRAALGKAAVRRLRREDNQVPGIIYGGGEAPVAFSIAHNVIQRALQNEAFYSRILTIIVGNKGEQAVLKAIQRHPSKPRIMHLDFLRVRANEKLTVQVPLHFTGEEQAPGAKLGGGVFSHLLTELEIRCLPANLPEFITVDVSQMQLEDALHLSQLQLPANVELAIPANDRDHDHLVVSLHKPHVSKEETTETPAAPAPTSPTGEAGA